VEETARGHSSGEIKMRLQQMRTKKWRWSLAGDAYGGGAEDMQAFSFLDENDYVEIFFFPARFEFHLLSKNGGG
jgi:hypothetical protein